MTRNAGMVQRFKRQAQYMENPQTESGPVGVLPCHQPTHGYSVEEARKASLPGASRNERDSFTARHFACLGALSTMRRFRSSKSAKPKTLCLRNNHQKPSAAHRRDAWGRVNGGNSHCSVLRLTRNMRAVGPNGPRAELFKLV